jgi:hypothetical protein
VKRVAWLWFMAIVGGMVFLASPVQAASPTLCTRGMAQSMLQSFGVTVFVQESRGIRRVDGFDECMYRLFADGEHFTFSEDEFFLGRTGYFFPYRAEGVSRAEAIAEIEMIVDRVWIATVAPDGTRGELVEQPLIYTAFKNVISEEEGPLVYQQRGFIAQLPPGDYVTILVTSFPGEPDGMATVSLHIEPAG